MKVRERSFLEEAGAGGGGGGGKGGGVGGGVFLKNKEDLPSCTLTVILSLEDEVEKRTLRYEEEPRHKIQDKNPVKECINRIQHVPEESSCWNV